MDHPEYSEKYAEGAEKSDIPGKIKQAADARFLDGSSGWFVSGGLTAIGQSSNPMGSLEVGYAGYQTSYFTQRVGLVAAANDDDFFLGGELGVRFQTPTRLAPFLGLGIFTGVASTTESAEDDHEDNDSDGSVDERGEERVNFDGALSAFYPEIGAHFWWTSRLRISGFGRYLVTTEGRDADAWYYGVSFAVFR
ncbi:hypothetical protein [Neorhodopirellula pilleata]|uniref:Outer membrane protein beta-barrel domain-containing protein n=1 Tax=Neorhodopirellula pilleata TaxID=2714738 RepID=A0A5C6AIJ6_9BACT|nr:hypothetical protein [Neorhodopirellula pilleata]TWT98995.1 hypothetical protein Pla100_21610 [Neorhodopirellula pilleata]